MSNAARKMSKETPMDYATRSDIERLAEKLDKRFDRIEEKLADLPALRNQLKILTAIWAAIGISGLGLLTTYIAKHAF